MGSIERLGDRGKRTGIEIAFQRCQSSAIPALASRRNPEIDARKLESNNR